MCTNFRLFANILRRVSPHQGWREIHSLWRVEEKGWRTRIYSLDATDELQLMVTQTFIWKIVIESKQDIWVLEYKIGILYRSIRTGIVLMWHLHEGCRSKNLYLSSVLYEQPAMSTENNLPCILKAICPEYWKQFALGLVWVGADKKLATE